MEIQRSCKQRILSFVFRSFSNRIYRRIASVVLFFYRSLRHGWIFLGNQWNNLRSQCWCLRKNRFRRTSNPKKDRNGTVAARPTGKRRMSLNELVSTASFDPTASQNTSSNPADNSSVVAFRPRSMTMKQRLSVHYVHQQRQQEQKESSSASQRLQQSQSSPHSPNNAFRTGNNSERAALSSVTPQTSSFVNRSFRENPHPIDLENPVRPAEAVAQWIPSTKSDRSIAVPSSDQLKASQIVPFHSGHSEKQMTPLSKTKSPSFLLYNVLKTTPKHYRKTSAQAPSQHPKFQKQAELSRLKRTISAVDKDLKTIFFFRKPTFFIR